MTTYFIQIVDNSRQIAALDVWHPFLILLPMKYVAKLIMEVGGRPVEVAQLFQRIA